MQDRSKGYPIDFTYIQPGKPTPNVFVEGLNGSFMRGVLIAYLFQDMRDLRIQAISRTDDYNNHSPYISCMHLPPLRYDQGFLQAE